MKVLVYGATGSQQFPVIASLKKRGVDVFASTHTVENIERLKSAGASPKLADLTDLNRVHDITAGMDGISFLVPFFIKDPGEGLQYAKNVIDAAVSNNIKKFVWNTSGFILKEKIGNPALDIRIDILNYLKQSGLSFIAIQPSVYAENLLGPWTAPFVREQSVVAYPTPEEMRIGWMVTKDVAEIVAECFFHPELLETEFRVSGLENLSGKELARKFSTALKREIEYHHLPAKEFGRILDELYGAGVGDPAAAAYQQISDSGIYPDMFAAETQQLLTRLSLTSTDMVQWVSEHKKMFIR
jgi:uncharacterized protein YbjT (DUF2867 family)